MTPPIDPEDAVKAAGWIARNVPTLVRWFRWFRRGKAALLLLALAVVGCTTAQIAGGIAAIGVGAKIIGALPDIPQPPGETPTVTPTVQPAPTATPTLTPTTTPTSTPAAPEPTLPPAPLTPPTATPVSCAPKPGPTPATLVYRGGCPRYMEPLDFEGEGAVNVPGDKRLCAVKAGVGNGRTAWRLGYGLGRQGMRLERFGDVWLQFDAGRGCADAYGRHFPDCETLYQHPEPDGEFSWGGYVRPVYCEDMPTPAPTAGPTPTPGTVPTGGVRGFSLGWTNVSDHCRGFRPCSCEPDGAHRFKGTLVPQEKFVQNTVDRDHWHCAIEPCVKPEDKTDAEWAEILQAHRDVYQLSGGDEWIVAQGIRHEWRYAGDGTIHVATPESNPYMATFDATCGATVDARGCMDAGAYSCPDSKRGEKKDDGTHYSEYDCRPENRRPVPGAGQCGPWKTYEVR